MSETQPDPPRRPRMLVVAERNVPDPESPVAPSMPTPSQAAIPARDTNQTTALQDELIARRAWRQGVIGSLNLAAAILAARLILLLATVGAFALSWLAIQTAQPMQLGGVALYLAGVVLPLTWLSGRR